MLKKLAGENKEEFYKVSPYIAEFWKTISNLPFIVLGTYHLILYSPNINLQVVYSLLIIAGIFSGFHHATNYKCMMCSHEITWTLIIDWIPILISVIYIIVTRMFLTFGIGSLIFIGVSILWLLIDNVFAPFAHWGHCIWHILIAFAISNAYEDYK
jgi:hypothetical protein